MGNPPVSLPNNTSKPGGLADAMCMMVLCKRSGPIYWSPFSFNGYLVESSNLFGKQWMFHWTQTNLNLLQRGDLSMISPLQQTSTLGRTRASYDCLSIFLPSLRNFSILRSAIVRVLTCTLFTAVWDWFESCFEVRGSHNCHS